MRILNVCLDIVLWIAFLALIGLGIMNLGYLEWLFSRFNAFIL